MTIKQIEEVLEEGESLKALTQAYAEIANIKIKKIRAKVERNRLFSDEILKVYGMIKAIAIKKKVMVTKPKNRLCILLTSNYRFYGSVNNSLISYFVGSTRQLSDVDKVILGKGGIEYFRTTKLLSTYQEITLKDDTPTAEELTDLANLSSKYNQVLVFHSKFKSLLVQEATFTDITALSLYTKDYYLKSFNVAREKDLTHFIFEPELTKILEFFDSQIALLLLEETFLESELSRSASRFISMDEAETKANKFIKEYQTLKAYVKRSIDNNKILENFASMMAVRKGDL